MTATTTTPAHHLAPARLTPVLDWRPGPVLLPAAVLLLTFCLPGRLVLGGLGAAGRPAAVLGAGVLALWAVAHLSPATRPVRCWPLRRVLLVLWCATAAAYALGLDRGLTPAEARSSDRALLVLLGYSGLLLAVAEGVRTRAQLERLLQVAVLGAGFMGLVGFLQFFGVDLTLHMRLPGLTLNGMLIGVGERGSGGFPRVAGTAGHYIEFGAVCALVLPLAVHLARRAPKGRATPWVVVLLLSVGVPFSISRTSFLALAVALGVVALGWSWRVRFNALVLACTAVAVLEAARPGLLGTIKSLFVNAENDPSVQGRTADYAVVWPMILDRPWFGRGPGTFIPEQYLILDNQVLGTLLSTGWVGMLALLGVVGAALSCAVVVVRRGDPADADAARALAACVLAVLVCSFTFDSLGFATCATVFFFALGALFALWRLGEGAGSAAAVVRDPGVATPERA